MSETEHRVAVNTVIGGLHPDAVHVSDHADGGVGIHVSDGAVHVALFGTLDDLRAIIGKIAFELGKIHGARIADQADQADSASAPDWLHADRLIVANGDEVTS